MFGRRFFGLRYFGARYFDGGGTAVPAVASVTDFDLFDEIRRLIEATGQFDAVDISTPVDQIGTAADRARLCVIHPDQWEESTNRNTDIGDGLEFDHFTRYWIDVIVRGYDPRERDRECDRLYGVIANAIVGRSILGATVEDTTIIRRGRYERPDASQRILRLNGEFSYFVRGSSNHGDDE